jgi:TorA maturation chaperone TorD
MIVDIEELRAIIAKLLDAVETNGGKVEIEADYYWDVPNDDRYDSYASPTQLTIGQLSDDWNELKRIGRGDAAALPYALVWASSVLRRIGEQALPATSSE